MNAQKVLSANGSIKSVNAKSASPLANKQTMMVIGVLVVIGILIGVSAYFYDDWFGEEDEEDVITPIVDLKDCPEGETCSVINDSRWVHKVGSAIGDPVVGTDTWTLEAEDLPQTLKQCASSCAAKTNCQHFIRTHPDDGHVDESGFNADEVASGCTLSNVAEDDDDAGITHGSDADYDTYVKVT